MVNYTVKTNPVKRTTHPPSSLPPTEPVKNGRTSKKRRLDVHHDLDDILKLPINPSKVRLNRGWRTRPGTNERKRSGASTRF